jgi:L-ascorbate metabolism protein UlaG (beta-lactamase superfamily)
MECPLPNLNLTLIGGPTVLIEYEGLRILTDPTFDPPGLYKETPVRFEKTSGPALSVAEIGKLDAVLLSHDHHFDNLDNAGRAMLPSVDVVYTTKAGATRLGGNARGLDPFESCNIRGANGQRLFVAATPAPHGPIGIEPMSGDVVGFALGVDRPGDLLYITGDTVWFDGTAEVSQRFSPKAVILFTGAAEPRGRFHMTMGSEDALEAAHAFPRSALLSVHNEGWVHLRESQDQLADVFNKFGLADRLTRFDRGKRLSLAV